MMLLLSMFWCVSTKDLMLHNDRHAVLRRLLLDDLLCGEGAGIIYQSNAVCLFN
jgi:hypothetical protein